MISLTGNNEEGLVQSLKWKKNIMNCYCKNTVGSTDKSVMEIQKLMEDSLNKHISKLGECVIKNTRC